MASGELAHDRETDAGADGAAGHRARRVEPFEHVREVGRGDARPVVVDPELDLTAGGVAGDAATATTTSTVAYFNAFSTRLATIWPSRWGSASAGAASPGSIDERDADLRGRRAERVDRVAHDRPGVDRRRVQRELVGVEPGEVEQVGDEPLEAAGLGRDHVRGPDAVVLPSTVPSAIASA